MRPGPACSRPAHGVAVELLAGLDADDAEDEPGRIEHLPELARLQVPVAGRAEGLQAHDLGLDVVALDVDVPARRRARTRPLDLEMKAVGEGPERRPVGVVRVRQGGPPGGAGPEGATGGVVL